MAQATSAWSSATSYRFIPAELQEAVVIAGFEPLDILHGIWMVLKQIAEGRMEIENQYKRVVPAPATPQPWMRSAKVFELREFFEWRGLGFDLRARSRREEYAEFDAERKFSVPALQLADPKSCQCGEVLKGVIKPWDCKVFGRDCTPETPLGALMVSSEGACAAYYQYGDIEKIHDTRALVEEMA